MTDALFCAVSSEASPTSPSKTANRVDDLTLMLRAMSPGGYL